MDKKQAYNCLCQWSKVASRGSWQWNLQVISGQCAVSTDINQCANSFYPFVFVENWNSKNQLFIARMNVIGVPVSLAVSAGSLGRLYQAARLVAMQSCLHYYFMTNKSVGIYELIESLEHSSAPYSWWIKFLSPKIAIKQSFSILDNVLKVLLDRTDVMNEATTVPTEWNVQWFA